MEMRRRKDEPARQHTVSQDLPRSVDIGQERLQGSHPLRDARLDDLPLL